MRGLRPPARASRRLADQRAVEIQGVGEHLKGMPDGELIWSLRLWETRYSRHPDAHDDSRHAMDRLFICLIFMQ